eukprot:Tbor_TRINITY_DN2372_c0_g1::TRINITY_DN2372_c0_g1_i1::g.206::m.206
MLKWTRIALNEPLRSLRLSDLLSNCSATDIVFARKIKNRGANFFAWPGVAAEEVAAGMLQFPENLRTVHTVFGRDDTPVDLAFDIDENIIITRTMRSPEMIKKYQRDVITSSLEGIHSAIADKGHAVDSQVVLVSPNLQKVSFHVHIKLKDVAFKDVTHLGAFVRTSVAPKLPKIDVQIYRQMGMLRIFQSKKDDMTSPLSVYAPEFQINIPKASVLSGAGERDRMSRVTNPDNFDEEALMLHSFIVRPTTSFSKFVNISPEDLEAARFARMTGNIDGLRDNQVKPPMPMTKAEALLNAKDWMDALPAELAMEFSTWVKVGLLAHRIGAEFDGLISEDIPGLESRDSMQEMLKCWINFSKKVPHKYKTGDCEQRFMSMRPNMEFYSAYCALAALVPQE